MAKKADIKKLLNKKLTGKEAGKLVVQDNWLVDNGEKGFLSERDLSSIKSGLLQAQDINDYNSYIETYRLIDYTLKEAQIMALETQKKLYAMNEWLHWHFAGNSAIGYKLTPTIMTKKEYEEKLDQEKATYLKEIKELGNLILEGFIAGATGLTVSGEIPEDANLYHWHSKNRTPEWKNELSELINLIKADKLKPVFITGSQRAKLEEAWSTYFQQLEQADREPLDFEKIDDGEQDIAEVLEPNQLREYYDKLLKAFYKSGKRSYSQKRKKELLAFLERAKEGSSSGEELDEWLDYTFLSGEDLYNSGAEDYKKFIDELQPDTGTMFGDIAILVTEGIGIIDERGYYRSIPFRQKKSPEEAAELISEGFKSVKETMRTLLGIQSVLEAVSELIGVDFTTGIDQWIDEAKALIKEINKARLYFFRSAENKEMAEIVKPINLSSLKPSAGIVKLFRERMATGLGREWWNESLNAVATDALQRTFEDGGLSKASKEHMAKRGYSLDKDGTLWQE